MCKTILLVVIAICGFVLFALVGCDSREGSQPTSDSTTSTNTNVSSNQLEGIKASVSAYIKGGLASDKEAVTKVSVPGSAVLKQTLTDLHEIEGISNLNLIEVHADTQNAIAVSSPISADHGRQGALVFSLILEAGKWLIADIGVEDQEGVTSEITRFKQKCSLADKLL